jgi:hypothetical protein
MKPEQIIQSFLNNYPLSGHEASLALEKLGAQRDAMAEALRKAVLAETFVPAHDGKFYSIGFTCRLCDAEWKNKEWHSSGCLLALLTEPAKEPKT